MEITSAGAVDHQPRGLGRRLRVLHVLPQDQNRGAQVYAGRIRDGFRGDEVQDHLLVTLFAGLGEGAFPDLSLDIPSGFLRRLLDVRALAALRALIRRLDVDLVIAHGGEALKYVIPAAGKIPVIYYKVGLSSAEIQRPLHRKLYRFLSQRAACVVGNSSAILSQVSELFNIPEARQRLIPNGRDPAVFRPVLGGETLNDPLRLLFVGQLEAGKRPGLFLDIVELLRASGRSFDAALAGDGPLREALEPRARSVGAEFLGIRDDIPDLMRKSAIVVMTSAPKTEGMPGVLIEAGLSGVPVVATAAAGVHDIVRDGETGYVLETGDVAAFAERVGFLLDDSEKRLALGAAARARCIRSFSIETSIVRWRSLISQMLGLPQAGKEQSDRMDAT